MRKKDDLDRETAFVTGVPLNLIRKITSTFLIQLEEALVVDGCCDLPRFGRFVVGHSAGLAGLHDEKLLVHKIHVRFHKKPRLKRRLEDAHMTDDEMSKYGVDETTNTPDSLEKHAATKDECPKCGSKLERHGAIVKCPNCGTEPFEGDQ